MLTSLTVENYALIESLRLELDPGLNIVTGETGAGKSILLGALGLLLGNRADASVIMDRGRNCVVEGIFDISRYGLEALFDEADVEFEAETVVRRVISPAGKSRAYVNDIPVQLPFLKELGAHLIDIHSQNQTLRIADEGFRLQVVDSMAGHGALADEYASVYAEMKRVAVELGRLREEAARSAADRQWLEHQVAELDGAALVAGEQAKLEAELDELAHAEEIKRVLAEVTTVLSREEVGVLVELKEAVNALEKIKGFYPAASEYAQRLRSVAEELKDIDRDTAAQAERVEADPQALARVEDRIALILSLLQKHKCVSLDELIQLHAGYRARLDAIEGSSEEIAALEKQLAGLEASARAVAAKITAGRRKAALAIGKESARLLAGLGLPDAVLVIEVTAAEALKNSGADDVRFLFSANAGIPPQPVEKTASGGEMSRLMLVLKAIAARSRKLPSIIFDEIDAGVSGKIADAMGEIINSLSGTMQVLNITHLPQVAAKGSCHLFVHKDVAGGRTRTAIRRLTDEERVDEIAKMLSGSIVTQAAVEQARMLLGLA